MSRRSDSISITRSRNDSICSIRLRHRIAPNTSAPRSRAYSARWLPTNPVMPVIKILISAILLHCLCGFSSNFDLNLLVALCRWCHDQTDAPYERGRLMVTALGAGQFTFEVVAAGGPWDTSGPGPRV